MMTRNRAVVCKPRPGCYLELNSRIFADKDYMPDWILYPLVVAGYFALLRWVLPRLGVST